MKEEEENGIAKIACVLIDEYEEFGEAQDLSQTYNDDLQCEGLGHAISMIDNELIKKFNQLPVKICEVQKCFLLRYLNNKVYNICKKTYIC